MSRKRTEAAAGPSLSWAQSRKAGPALRALRLQAGLGRASVADAAGLSTSMIANLERATSRWRERDAEKAAAYLGTTLADLLADDDERQAVEPYRTELDHDGARLAVRECGQGDHGYIEVEPDTRGLLQACVQPEDAPALLNAVCRAGGQEPPVMLGRPDLDALRNTAGCLAFRGLQVWPSEDGGLTFGIGANTETLTAAQVRTMAAAAVALADQQPALSGGAR